MYNDSSCTNEEIMIKYSIITPVYNREDCILRCMHSVTKQLCNYVDIEHVIVDDGSTDQTPKIIKDYSSTHQHVVYLSFPDNKGTNAARNAAITIAKGEFCIILDSDDYFVDNAIKIINDVVERSNYGHYIFATDDMQATYANNPLLKCEQRDIAFKYFLNGDVAYDFVHVIKTNTLKDLPFDEYLRIYEGVFFLRFYKHTKSVLFTNTVVTNRERSRKDSVTRTAFRTNKDAIRKSIVATEMQLNWFENDFVELSLKNRLKSLKRYLFDNYLLIGDYKKAKKTLTWLTQNKTDISLFQRMIFLFHLGWFYRFILKSYLLLKYSLLKRKLKV